MRKSWIAVPLAVALMICGCLLLGGCSGGSSGGGGGGAAAAAHTDLLWSVTKLASEMAIDQDLLVLDCRKNIANPGKDGADVVEYNGAVHKPGNIYTPYKVSHIPGAHYINFFIFGDPYYPSDDSAVIATLSALGITQSTKICLYDTQIGNPQGKVFFHLERLGCTDVHILDGGFEAWVDAGKTEEKTDPAARTPTNFVPTYDNSIYMELAGFKAVWDKVDAGSTDYAIIDYREDPLFQGHKLCPDALRTGYITHTELLNWRTYMDSRGFMKSQDDIIKLTEAAGGSRNKTNILICNKGWRSGFTYFALRYAGWPKSILVHYVGGVRDWTFQTDTNAYPMATEACYRPGKFMPKAAGNNNAKRFCGAAAQVGSKLYCIGGYVVAETKSTVGKADKVVLCDSNQAFDIAQLDKDLQWENDLKPLPVPTAFSVGAAVNGYIYVMGGVTGTLDNPVKTNKVYKWDSLNPSSDWVEVDSMPSEYLSYAAAAIGDYIYVFGGLSDPNSGLPANYSNNFMRYDTVGDSWEQLNTTPQMPHARRCHALVTEGNNLYLVGGFYKEDDGAGGINNVDLRDIHVIDTSDLASGWTQLADLPMDCAGHSAALVNSKIYVVGAWTLDGVKYDVMEYNIATNSSRILKRGGNSACIGWPRYWYFIGAYGDEIASIGGYGGGSGYIKTTDTSGFAHFHQPYIYNTMSPFDP